jgi:hypothetical protein
MNEKQKLAGFRALVRDHLNCSYYFEEMDGSHRQWSELSPQSKLQYIAGDAAIYDVPFERFEDTVREVLPAAVLVEASLRTVLHYEQELRGLARLLPDHGGTESVPLVERFKEILHSQSDRREAGEGMDRDIER